MPMRKRTRTGSFVKLPSLHYRSSDQTTAPINERSAEDPQVQTPSAPVHHSPAPDHRVDVTTEDDILSRFKIGKMLGVGGFGKVYEGKHLEDGLELLSKPKFNGLEKIKTWTYMAATGLNVTPGPDYAQLRPDHCTDK
ncbi:serine/threonine-protein kinase pim-2 [Pimephales promelas]|nr:serine/threonine-protein kinase pim-2 [Pimephales promelas]